MKNLYLDKDTNDLVIENGNLKMTENNLGAVSQKIQSMLKVVQGEWFLDPSLGVPYFTRIFKKIPDFNDIKTILLSVIVSTEGVAAVTSFVPKYSKSTREYSVTFTATLENGTILEDETIRGISL